MKAFSGLFEPRRINHFPEKVETVWDAVEYLKAKFYMNECGDGEHLSSIHVMLLNYYGKIDFEKIVRNDPMSLEWIFQDCWHASSGLTQMSLMNYEQTEDAVARRAIFLLMGWEQSIHRQAELCMLEMSKAIKGSPEKMKALS